MKNRHNVFQRVPPAKVGRSVFNLSHEVKLTATMGLLYPILCEDCIPGDVWRIGNELVIRFHPLLAPLLHNVYATVHYYFVSYSDLCRQAVRDDLARETPTGLEFDWESFISGGEDGQDAQTLPTWNVTTNTKGSLWDHLRFPLAVDAAGARPVVFPKWAYNHIYNHYYRDENLIEAIDITDQEALLRAAWEKDYFTSCLPWQQRGISGALPVDVDLSGALGHDWPAVSASNPASMQYNTSNFQPYAAGTKSALEGVADHDAATDITVNSTTFDIEDLRLAFQIQRWQERNARAGVRYTELLRGHFGLAPRDERLERPEYIGGSRNPIIFSEVIQSSETNTTPQGHLAGKGISVNRNPVGSYRVQEFGLIMGILCIRPRTAYHQGIDRQWLKETRYDFVWPEFSNISEQEVLERELYCDGTEAHHLTVFGYQGRYNEYRFRSSAVCGDMHADFDHWHLCRQFAARPTLDSTFIECTPRTDVYAAPSEDPMIISFGNVLIAARPLPLDPTPGFVDR